MKKYLILSLSAASLVILPATSNAVIVSVTSGNSSLGSPAAIIAAPSSILDDSVTNGAMQGFNEAQNVTLASSYSIDGGGTLAAGTTVSSHMIFLNNEGNSVATHFDVLWTFDTPIIGVMSDRGGNLEAASTGELGALLTNYTMTFPNSGAAAPFGARGLESNNGTGSGDNDGYLVSGNTINVGMKVTEPGDWIRVITEGKPVPDAGQTAMLLGLALSSLGFARKRLARKG